MLLKAARQLAGNVCNVYGNKLRELAAAVRQKLPHWSNVAPPSPEAASIIEKIWRLQLAEK
ncbi:hypothetical protein KIN20_035522 [Parelaphostrongylus tenuis]|uniref:Uncharacterized protein n=1 Tax=Parelaphostrongylus tenuis TaxID=148309 RepID=A0AAD5RBB8_PARTN|nr:hypothetical protein KIN20_035522 [Parelaphostrongylus tenuis]